MSGKGLENIDRLDASYSYSNIDVSNLPDYIYEMRSMNAFICIGICQPKSDVIRLYQHYMIK